ncbi:hypothetical protein PoMZ_10881, partial [Pyricularia oryzae]
MLLAHALISITTTAALATRKEGPGCVRVSQTPRTTPTPTVARTCTSARKSTGTQTWLAKTGCAVHCSQTASCVAD